MNNIIKFIKSFFCKSQKCSEGTSLEKKTSNSIYIDSKIISHDKTLSSGRSRHVYFGKPRGTKFQSFDLLPANMKAVSFYFGGDQLEFIKSFFLAGCHQELEEIEIGCSSVSETFNLDYTEIISFLSTQGLSHIKCLKLGGWQLYSNSESFFGKLGDLTILLNNLPQLHTLSLAGYFSLKEKLSFENLKSINIEIDNYIFDMEDNCITQSTLNCLLDSEYNCCEKMYLDLSVVNTQNEFVFPQYFLSATGVQSLKSLTVIGAFKKDEMKKFEVSKLANQVGMKNICIN